MATSSHLLRNVFIKGSGWQPLLLKTNNFAISERFRHRSKKFSYLGGHRLSYCCLAVSNSTFQLLPSSLREPPHIAGIETSIKLNLPPDVVTSDLSRTFLLADLDPATAKLAIGILGPFLSAFAFLFILRIVMSWYPKLPVEKFPYVIAYAPTEPFLTATRKVIPPLGGVDVTPVVWFGLVSFLNEILVGPQGLLVLISQQVS
ncbi:putative ycf19 [Gossypium arboreum]|uniref:Putative ycf19 n=1 Tax=Gossypium arboreum TaxID=29729 RepID=A0A0B0NKE1_GOSAR|nr:putative ycf19 [Gossypium arboreum]